MFLLVYPLMIYQEFSDLKHEDYSIFFFKEKKRAGMFKNVQPRVENINWGGFLHFNIKSQFYCTLQNFQATFYSFIPPHQ